MKPSPKRTVKAWILLQKATNEDDFYTVTFPIYRKRKDAGNTKTNMLLKHWKVVSCTITYSLPTPRKKK